MAAKIFLWVMHPRAGSLTHGLGDAYQAGAAAAGAEVRRLNLDEMQFDTGFEGYTGRHRPLELDLLTWQDALSWAEHVAFLHPYWWGGMPARAKSVLDRALTPGFGFKYRGNSVFWDKLLTGRTGDVIINSDTPPWYDTLIYHKPGRRVLRNQVFKFCGIKSRKILQVGPVKTATPEKIQKWLAEVEEMGRSAGGSPD